MGENKVKVSIIYPDTKVNMSDMLEYSKIWEKYNKTHSFTKYIDAEQYTKLDYPNFAKTVVMISKELPALVFEVKIFDDYKFYTMFVKNGANYTREAEVIFPEYDPTNFKDPPTNFK